MGNETASVRLNKTILGKVKKHLEKTKQSISGFYDLAALEKIKFDKMSDKIVKQSLNPSKYD